MQKLIPHLWFDGKGAEAAAFYTTVIPKSRFEAPTTLRDTPSGEVEVFQVTLGGLDFQFLSARADFRFTPAVSFRLTCHSAPEVDMIVEALADGGSFLMPLGSYPFSGRYAWLADRFGLSWQIMLDDIHPTATRIIPTLMFVGPQAGQAETAVRYYASLFPRSVLGEFDRYEEGPGPDRAGTIRQVGFHIGGVDLAAMDSAGPHHFSFTEALSFVVRTEDQEETDFYWDNLSADTNAEACGWLKDRWGVSWQIVPEVLRRLMGSGNTGQISAVTQAFLKMKKLDIATLEQAFHLKAD